MQLVVYKIAHAHRGGLDAALCVRQEDHESPPIERVDLAFQQPDRFQLWRGDERVVIKHDAEMSAVVELAAGAGGRDAPEVEALTGARGGPAPAPLQFAVLADDYGAYQVDGGEVEFDGDIIDAAGAQGVDDGRYCYLAIPRGDAYRYVVCPRQAAASLTWGAAI